MSDTRSTEAVHYVQDFNRHVASAGVTLAEAADAFHRFATAFDTPELKAMMAILEFENDRRRLRKTLTRVRRRIGKRG